MTILLPKRCEQKWCTKPLVYFLKKKLFAVHIFFLFSMWWNSEVLVDSLLYNTHENSIPKDLSSERRNQSPCSVEKDPLLCHLQRRLSLERKITLLLVWAAFIFVSVEKVKHDFKLLLENIGNNIYYYYSKCVSHFLVYKMFFSFLETHKSCEVSIIILISQMKKAKLGKFCFVKSQSNEWVQL